jgi:uroporphyrinogen decarboxylase
MTPRERVIAAIEHRETDRVPVDYWGTPEYDTLLIHHFGVESRDRILEKLGVDLRYIYASGIIYEDPTGLFKPTPRYIGPPRSKFPDGSFEDLWGVTRKLVKVHSGNSYHEAVKNPLRHMTSLLEIQTYDKWPQAEDFDFSNMRDACMAWPDYAIVVGGMPGCATVFIQCWYSRGLDQILLDLIEAPDIAHAIIEKITVFQLEYHRRLLDEIGDLVQILMLADDFGTQQGLMMSPQHFREFFRKPLESLIALGKEYELKIMLHCDGHIRRLIPDFIEMGIDILNPIQNVGPGMEPEGLKREFGKNLCFHGGIDTQEVLPHISPQEVKREVEEKAELLSKGGGYIISPTHMLQLDVPLKNVIAFYEPFGIEA